jgi:calcineurin-like phosphoesterase family protein
MKKYKLEEDQVMFTADTHFGHTSIIHNARRPYKDAVDMDAELIINWNKTVRPDQVVFHLGDFAFNDKWIVPNLLNLLNGEVILIQGNHDEPENFKHFKAVHDVAEVEVGEQRIIMCHDVMPWNLSFRGAWHIHGHSHGKLTPDYDKKIFDIGVDAWHYLPVSFYQLKRKALNYDFTT